MQAAYASLAAANANNANVRALLGVVPVNAFAVRGVQQFAGVGGQSSSVYNADHHEFQPRAGFAYQVRPTTVIRGGIGRFTASTFDTGGQNGFNRSTPFVQTQDNYTTPYDTLANPFHTGVLTPTGSSLGPLTNLGQGVSWNYQTPMRPYSLIFSLLVQQQVKNWLFEVGYRITRVMGYPGRAIKTCPVTAPTSSCVRRVSTAAGGRWTSCFGMSWYRIRSMGTRFSMAALRIEAGGDQPASSAPHVPGRPDTQR